MDRSKITFGGITMKDEVKAVLLGIPTAEGVLIRLALLAEESVQLLLITFQQHIPRERFSAELLEKIEDAPNSETIEGIFSALLLSEDLIDPVTTQMIIGPLGEELCLAAKIAGKLCIASETTGAWRKFFDIK